MPSSGVNYAQSKSFEHLIVRDAPRRLILSFLSIPSIGRMRQLAVWTNYLVTYDYVLTKDLLNALLKITHRSVISLPGLNFFELSSLASRLSTWPTRMVPLGDSDVATSISNENDTLFYSESGKDEVYTIVGDDYFPVLGQGHRPPSYRPLANYPFSKVLVHSEGVSEVVYSGVVYFEVSFLSTPQSRVYAAERAQRLLQLQQQRQYTNDATIPASDTTATRPEDDSATISSSLPSLPAACFAVGLVRPGFTRNAIEDDTNPDAWLGHDVNSYGLRSLGGLFHDSVCRPLAPITSTSLSDPGDWEGRTIGIGVIYSPPAQKAATLSDEIDTNPLGLLPAVPELFVTVDGRLSHSCPLGTPYCQLHTAYPWFPAVQWKGWCGQVAVNLGDKAPFAFPLGQFESFISNSSSSYATLSLPSHMSSSLASSSLSSVMELPPSFYEVLGRLDKGMGAWSYDAAADSGHYPYPLPPPAHPYTLLAQPHQPRDSSLDPQLHPSQLTSPALRSLVALQLRHDGQARFSVDQYVHSHVFQRISNNILDAYESDRDKDDSQPQGHAEDEHGSIGGGDSVFTDILLQHLTDDEMEGDGVEAADNHHGYMQHTYVWTDSNATERIGRDSGMWEEEEEGHDDSLLQELGEGVSPYLLAVLDRPINTCPMTCSSSDSNVTSRKGNYGASNSGTYSGVYYTGAQQDDNDDD